MSARKGNDMAQKIVVGIDGSSGGSKALEFAFEEAQRRDADLVGLYAWHYPTLAATPAPFGGLPVPPLEEMEAAAREALDHIMSEIDVPAGVRFEGVVREGSPAGILLDESESADLIVVGTRGHGGFKGLLLGSVSHQVVSHAECPVVVVPSD